MELADIRQVGVVGSGTMGFGIAINFALWGYPTTMHDLNDEILAQSMRNVEHAMQLFVEGELISPQRADKTIGRMTTTTDLAHVAANSDFITEAIVERSRDKRALFNRLDALCPPHTIFASNTSRLVLSDFGAEVKRQDKLVITHCCGSIVDILPDAIEIGLDVLESCQPEARGMNPYDLKKKFGDKLTFWGCLGSQSVIPFGTPEEIRAEVQQLCREMGKGGGFILGPAKSLQPGTPTENAAAVVEAFAEQR